MHPSHEAGMDIACRIRRDEIGELPVDIGEIGWLTGKRGAKSRANLVRDRTPHRTLADLGDVVDHVIEHAMTLRTKLAPVLRIERFALSGLRLRFVQRLGHAGRSRRCRTRSYSMIVAFRSRKRSCSGFDIRSTKPRVNKANVKSQTTLESNISSDSA